VKVLTTQGVDEQTAGSVAPLLAQSLPEGIGMEEFRDRVLSEFAAIGGVLPNSVPKRYVEQAAAYEAQGFTPEQAAENARNSQAANQEDVDAANAQNATVRRGLTNLQGGNRSNAGSSTLPGEAAAALVSMAQTALRAGQNFAQWAASMVQRFGEAVRQYLQGAWQAATQTSEVGALNFTSALGPQLQAAANNRQPRSTTVNNRQLLTTAHAAAARGSSTQMVPIRRVYEEARRQNPALTPEQFQAQVMAEYEAGTVLLEGSGSRQEAESAGLRIDGTPVGTAVRMMVLGNPALQNPASGATRAAMASTSGAAQNAEPSPGGLSEGESLLYNAIMQDSDPGDRFSDRVSIQRPNSRIAGFFLGVSPAAVKGYGNTVKALAVKTGNAIRLDQENYTPQEFSDEFFSKTGIRPKVIGELHNDPKFREPVYTFFSPGIAANEFDSRQLARSLAKAGFGAVEMLDDSAYDGPQQDQKAFTTWIPYPLAENIRVIGRVNPESSRAAAGTSPQGFTNLDPGARTGGFLNAEILAEGAALLQQGFTTFATWSKRHALPLRPGHSRGLGGHLGQRAPQLAERGRAESV
jgi:hypothetical protein